MSLTPLQKTTYACGDIADAVKNVALSQFLLFYLTVACALPGSLAGTLVFIALVVDAITDPIVGYLSDRTKSRWGRRHPFMFTAILPFALALAILFSMPHFDSIWARFSYALAALIVLRVSFSIFVLPYAAMTAELSSDYTERSVIMTYRNLLNICANVATVTLGFGVFLAADGALESRAAYQPFGWACAALVAIGAGISTVSTYKLRHYLKDVRSSPQVPLSHVFNELRTVLANRSFGILAGTIVVFWIAQGTHGSLGVHAFRYFWDLEATLIRDILYVNTIGLALGIPLCGLCLKRMEKKTICAFAIGSFCIAQFTPPTLALAGLLQGPVVLYVLGGFALLTGMAMTCVHISFGSMMADATDEYELHHGLRREGLFYSGLTFGGKCAIGLGAFIAGIMLDVIGFPTDLATNPSQVLSADVATDLGIVYGPGTSLISILAAYILSRHSLSRSRHIEITTELKRRAQLG